MYQHHIYISTYQCPYGGGGGIRTPVQSVFELLHRTTFIYTTTTICLLYYATISDITPVVNPQIKRFVKSQTFSTRDNTTNIR